MSVVPKQKPGKSDQNVVTPPDFLRAVYNKFSHVIGDYGFVRDLAADSTNTVSKAYFTEQDNALIQPWADWRGVQWCNPPYGHIRPWVTKAVEEAKKGAEIFMLVPAAVGSNWWRDCVDTKASIKLLNGRITFVGHTHGYPKDLALLYFARYFMDGSYYSVWEWRKNL